MFIKIQILLVYQHIHLSRKNLCQQISMFAYVLSSDRTYHLLSIFQYIHKLVIKSNLY